MDSAIERRLDDETGATAIEYGLMVGVLAAAVTAGAAVLAPKIQTLLETVF